MQNPLKDRLLWLLIVVLSAGLLMLGAHITAQDSALLENTEGDEVIRARVIQILNRESDSYDLGEDAVFENVRITFLAQTDSGAQKGALIEAVQHIDGMLNTGIEEITPDKRILLIHSDIDEYEWHFMDYLRSDNLLLFAAVFALAVLVFGRFKGFTTLLSLLFNCLAVFMVFIPSIFAGYNIYVWSLAVCIYIVVTAMLIVHKPNRKSLASIIGCLGGVFVSGTLTVLMSRVLSLTGIVDEDSIYLTLIPTRAPIDLRAIIFAAIIIGAVGAIMDVSMSIASSLQEVHEASRGMTPAALFKSGIRIGQDVIGTMVNTLILAYIGGSLSVVLLLRAYTTSVLSLFNREMIIVEILQALVGSFGILLSIPLTAAACAFLYRARPKTLPPADKA